MLKCGGILRRVKKGKIERVRRVRECGGRIIALNKVELVHTLLYLSPKKLLFFCSLMSSKGVVFTTKIVFGQGSKFKKIHKWTKHLDEIILLLI